MTLYILGKKLLGNTTDTSEREASATVSSYISADIYRMKSKFYLTGR